MQYNFLSGDSLYRDVEIYNNTGEHRTGGEGEARTDKWLTGELVSAGLKVSYQEFTTRQFSVRESKLRLGDSAIDCFPYWFPCATVTGKLTGNLSLFNSHKTSYQRQIVIYERTSMIQSRPELEVLINNLTDRGALAVIFVSNSPSGEIAAVNTPHDAKSWPIPVVMVGKKDEMQLRMAAVRSIEITLSLEGQYRLNTKARNIFGRWGHDNNIIVISTPKSGWFNCGGERGPGIALALGIARWIGGRKTRNNYCLDFNSGHELNNMGTRHFLSERAPKPENVKAWVHLGANIATRDFNNTSEGLKYYANPARYPVVCSDDAFLPVVRQAFSNISEVKPYIGPGIGEFGPVIQAGYRGFGVYGGAYYYFHTPADGPQGTAPELLEAVMISLIMALTMIEKM